MPGSAVRASTPCPIFAFTTDAARSDTSGQKGETRLGSRGVQIDWPTKSAAVKQANTLSRTTARDFETLSGNTLIQGDNLDALKELRRVGKQTFKLTLIDPPYNTGGGFVYDDDRSEAAWLSFMLPRLMVARDVMTDDGLMMIFMDDSGLPLLRMLAREVFGSANDCGILIWEKKRKPSFLQAQMGGVTDYIAVFAKNRKLAPALTMGTGKAGKRYPFNNRGNPTGVLTFPADAVAFDLPDQRVTKQDMSTSGVPCKLLDAVEIKAGRNRGAFRMQGEWRYSQATLDTFVASGQTINISRLPFRPNLVKAIPSEKKISNLLSFRTNSDIPTNEDGLAEVTALFGGQAVFDYPKPIGLLKYLIEAATKPGDAILDFFAGTASAGHAVAKIGDGRTFTLVQDTAPFADTPTGRSAKKICEAEGLAPHLASLAAERLRRAGLSSERDFQIVTLR